MQLESKAFNIDMLESVFTNVARNNPGKLNEITLAKTCLKPGFKWDEDRVNEYYYLKNQWNSNQKNIIEQLNMFHDVSSANIQPLYGAPAPDIMNGMFKPWGTGIAVKLGNERIDKMKNLLTVKEFESIDVPFICYMSKEKIVKYRDILTKLIGAGVFDDDNEEEKVNE
jgi:hypothetical protein